MVACKQIIVWCMHNLSFEMQLVINNQCISNASCLLDNVFLFPEFYALTLLLMGTCCFDGAVR